MSVLAEKSFDTKAVMNQHEPLFHRHPANPILAGGKVVERIAHTPPAPTCKTIFGTA